MNRGEICDGRFFAKVKHHEESLVQPIKLSEVGEDTGISVDVAEPPTAKRELCLTQVVQETVLSQNRAFIFLLDLEEREKQWDT